MGDFYLFIDGDYFRRFFFTSMRNFIEQVPDVDFNEVRSSLGAHKVFFYDCEGLEPTRPESREVDDSDVGAFADWSRRQRDLIRKSDMYKLRYGSLRKPKKGPPKQKEIDVLIAVDMLTHASRRNMGTAALFSGDLDFRPVLEGLEQLGVRTTLVFERMRTSEDLIEAADMRRAVTIEDAWSWVTPESRRAFPPVLVSSAQWFDDPLDARSLKFGTVDGKTAKLFHAGAIYTLHLEKGPHLSKRFQHSNFETLERL